MESEAAPGDLLACKSKILNLITGELWEPSPHFLTMNGVEYDYQRHRDR